MDRWKEGWVDGWTDPILQDSSGQGQGSKNNTGTNILYYLTN